MFPLDFKQDYSKQKFAANGKRKSVHNSGLQMQQCRYLVATLAVTRPDADRTLEGI